MEKYSLSREEAAQFMGIDRDTLTQWCRSGRIIFTKKNPLKPNSPYLFTRTACIAALKNPLQTVGVSAANAHEESTCHFSAEMIPGTPVSSSRTANVLSDLLGRRTKGRLRNSTTG
nr:helix-turn-helix domain-containing protein [Erwinia endophytica]